MAAVDFIHPIIQAYVQGRQLALEKAQQAQQQGQFTVAQQQQSEQFQKAHEQALKIAEQQHEIEQRRLDQQKAEAEHANAISGLQLLMQGAGQGADVTKLGGLLGGQPSQAPTLPPQGAAPTQQIPGSIGSGQPGTGVPGQPNSNLITIPGLGQVDLSALGGMSPEARGRQQIALAQAQQQALAPGQLSAFKAQQDIATQREVALEEARAKSQVALEGIRQKGENLRSNLQRETQLKIAGMSSSVQHERNALEFGLDPQAGTALGIDYFTGQQKPSTNSPIDRRIVTAGIEQGFKLPGKDIEELKDLDKLNPILDRFEAFSNKLPTSLAGAGLETVKAHLAPTELKNELSMINSDLQNVGKGLEGYSGGRILTKQFESEAGGVPNLGIPRQQALDRVNNLRQRVAERQQEILKAYPAAQKDLIQQRLGINIGTSKTPVVPDWLKIAPQTSKIGGKLDIDQSIKVGKPVYQ